MELEQYKFIYEDLKQQIKQIPPLQQLLKLTEKSTKKLQCLNLYSISDKRDFDLELEGEQIMREIIELYQQVYGKQGYGKQEAQEIEEKIEKIKQKNMQVFDLLNKQEELLHAEIEKVQYMLNGDGEQNEIKEEDEFDEENMKESSNTNVNPNQQRINALKKQIDEIGSKIAKLNNGRGTWYQTDHVDFVKIYNKYRGSAKKIIEEGVKILGMKNTEIMDHLEIYEHYLQLEKEKKIISEEYKQIKLYEKLEDDEKKENQVRMAEERRKMKKQKQTQENEKKKELIQKFKEKKMEEKAKMIQQEEKKEKEKIVRVPLPPAKKKQIIDRNQKYILERQNNFKKTQELAEQKSKMNRNLSRGKQTSGANIKSLPSGKKGFSMNKTKNV